MFNYNINTSSKAIMFTELNNFSFLKTQTNFNNYTFFSNQNPDSNYTKTIITFSNFTLV